MDISVIIVSWNAKQFLEICLSSLSEVRFSRTVEIVVVDNASSDGSPEMVERQFPQVRLVRNSENLGFAKANNVGIRESTGRYIALVNSDIRLISNCLDPLADYLDNHPNVGNVGPRILNKDMTLQCSCRRFPTIWNDFCDATGLYRLFKRSKFFSGEHMFFFPHDRTLEVDAIVGCFWMVRRRALERVGLLDEEFFMYAEDVDWCRRCWDAGWRIVFFPDVQAIHYRAGSSSNEPARFAIAQQHSFLRYWKKHHGWLAYSTIRSILLFRHVASYLVALFSQVLLMPDGGQDSNRLRVSAACIQALISRSALKKA